MVWSRSFKHQPEKVNLADLLRLLLLQYCIINCTSCFKISETRCTRRSLQHYIIRSVARRNLTSHYHNHCAFFYIVLSICMYCDFIIFYSSISLMLQVCFNKLTYLLTCFGRVLRISQSLYWCTVCFQRSGFTSASGRSTRWCNLESNTRLEDADQSCLRYPSRTCNSATTISTMFFGRLWFFFTYYLFLRCLANKAIRK